MSLPPFPVDDSTLDLIDMALNPGEGAERTSLGELLDLLSRLGGSDTDAVERIESGDPLGLDIGGAETHYMRDPCYHPNDVVAALVAEVRRLRGRIRNLERMRGEKSARAALARVEALCDAARPTMYLTPLDCTNVCGDDACNCSGESRAVAWNLNPDDVRAATGGQS